MTITIGFAVLSYNEPAQLRRLVTTLNGMFGAPPVVCHHNFSQCALDEAQFPPNVRFVHPHDETPWGHITTPLAALKAFDVLRAYARPDWFVLLSGSDYPVRPAREIAAELSDSKYDAYLDHREILYRALPPGQTALDNGFSKPSWIPVAYDRYCAVRFWMPVWWPRSSNASRSGLFPFQKRHLLFRSPRIIRCLQFDRPSRIYGGGFWFQANRKAIDRLLDHASMPSLVRYFRRRQIPEESLFHTVLCSQPDLRISRDQKRFEDWTTAGIGAHPKWFEASDLPKILASGAHYARKFRPNGELQDVIDSAVLRI